MTEAEIIFSKRRLRQELQLARDAENPADREMHGLWVHYFQERLAGRRGTKPGSQPAHDLVEP